MVCTYSSKKLDQIHFLDNLHKILLNKKNQTKKKHDLITIHLRPFFLNVLVTLKQFCIDRITVNNHLLR